MLFFLYICMLNSNGRQNNQSDQHEPLFCQTLKFLNSEMTTTKADLNLGPDLVKSQTYGRFKQVNMITTTFKIILDILFNKSVILLSV
jgi:hypothetical protein